MRQERRYLPCKLLIDTSPASEFDRSLMRCLLPGAVLAILIGGIMVKAENPLADRERQCLAPGDQ